MSLSHSPSIVTNGLVYYHDTGNTNKSWEGQPTTNLFTSPTDLTNAAWTPTSTTATTVTNVLGPDARLTVTKVVGNNGITARKSISQPVTMTSGITYTYSVYIKSAGFTNATIWFDTLNITQGSYYGASSLVSLLDGTTSGGPTVVSSAGNGWYRLSVTGTASATGSFVLNLSLGDPNGTGTATGDGVIGVYVCGAQIEVGTYATPFVIGTRSNTGVLFNMANTSTTITADSLTYASNNTFSLNGTSDGLTVTYNSSAFNFNDEQTIIQWMYNNAGSALRRNPYNQAYGGGGTITHEAGYGFNYYCGTAGTDALPYTGFGSSMSVVPGETAMICLTRNASTVSWYKNGVFSNSSANPYGTIVTGTNNITIGKGYTGYFAGNIYITQLYNKCLTAQEVLQNFTVMRGRFGI